MGGALDGIRVVEIGSRLTNYCGKLFAEMGADVVLVEPLEGSELRHEPPFADGVANGTSSYDFFYRNTSKRSVALDLDNPAGADVLARLVDGVDLVLDGQPPGWLAERGLDPAVLVERTPSQVVTSISPFGQTGPYAHYRDADLICMAFGGMLWMGGYADGPPVRAFGDQAYMAGSLFGAVASMVALTHAEFTGTGQHVDVSVQEAVAMGLENAAQTYDLEGRIRRRFGGGQREAGFGVFPCADGHVFLLARGIGGNRFWESFIAWMRDDGIDGAERLATPEWEDPKYPFTDEAKGIIETVFTNYSLTRTKREIYDAAQAWRVPLGPVNLPLDVLDSPQLRDRGFFVEVEAFGRRVEMPGAPYRLSETPWQLHGPAPRLGEHTVEVLTGVGLGAVELDALREAKVIE